MEQTTLGGKIMHIIAAILAVAGFSGGTALVLSQPDSRLPESNTIQQPLYTEMENSVADSTSNLNDSNTYTLENGIVVEIIPAPVGGRIASPLTVKGSVPSSTPKTRLTIRVVDPAGNDLANTSLSVANSGNGASASFSTTLKFSVSTGGMGSLQISSGNGRDLVIPIEF